MKRTVDTFSPEEMRKVREEFARERRAVLPPGWSPNPAGEYVNCQFYDNHYTGMRVLQEVELHDDGHLWLHVSVSLRGQTSRGGKLPTWRQMCLAKDLFIGTGRVAYQVHPRESEHVNEYEVLHLWCPLDYEPIPDLRNPTGKL